MDVLLMAIGWLVICGFFYWAEQRAKKGLEDSIKERNRCTS